MAWLGEWCWMGGSSFRPSHALAVAHSRLRRRRHVSAVSGQPWVGRRAPRVGDGRGVYGCLGFSARGRNQHLFKRPRECIGWLRFDPCLRTPSMRPGHLTPTMRYICSYLRRPSQEEHRIGAVRSCGIFSAPPALVGRATEILWSRARRGPAQAPKRRNSVERARSPYERTGASAASPHTHHLAL